QGVMEGYNDTAFAHGQTGSGKSFTMQGVADPFSQKGISPRAFEHIESGCERDLVDKFLLKGLRCPIPRNLLGADTKQKLE
ncbi:KIF17 protein, partial [Sylvia borin]|nr:KIF17 protein [Sylvia borin]